MTNRTPIDARLIFLVGDRVIVRLPTGSRHGLVLRYSTKYELSYLVKFDGAKTPQLVHQKFLQPE